MQQNHSGRVAVILAVLLLALWAIFPSMLRNPIALFNPKIPFSEKHNLKPGIDMVGGTSLTYEIKPPAGSTAQADLAERVMEALKKRVDPDGVRNLIWRPQGATRLEIQMPMTSSTGDAQVKRDAYAAAQKQLEATNVRASEVIRVVETMTGDARAAELKRLAAGSEQRDKLFGALRAAYDGIQDARKKQDAEAQANREIEYENLKKQIEGTNLSIGEMQAIMTSNADVQKTKLDALKQKYANFPERLAAIDAFVKAAKEYDAVKGAIDDATDLKRLLKGSGVLEFHILDTDYNSPEYQAMVERLQTKGPRLQAGDQAQWFQVDHPDDFQRPTVSYNDKKWALVLIDPEHSMANRSGSGAKWALEKAYPTQDQSGTMVVGFRFDATGATRFGDLTGANIGKPLAITLDEKLISAPNIQSQIHREGIITGGKNGFSRSELNYLISTLNAGSLPAQLAEEPISEVSVGPQLGADNLHRGLVACGLGLIVVAVFLVIYYYLAGVVAFIAVVMNLILILGSLAALNATFTLPSIAALVLTIGAAVDANVLIFERLREEQHRGLSLRMALRNAYDRAWSAIVDSNMTTAITSGVLYLFGSEEVKGFGLTLLIGLLFSMFTALFVTRTIFNILIDKFGVTKLGSLPLTFPKWDQLLRPNIDWMSKAWIFFTFSAVFIVAGLIAFGVKVHERQMMDIEFASGTAVQFELKQPASIGAVRDKLHAVDPHDEMIPSPSIVSVGAGDKTWEVVTPNPDRTQVQRTILKAFEGQLVIDVPSAFDGVDQPIDAVLNKSVIPIEKASQTIAGVNAPQIANYVGGVAIVLDHLDPPLSPEQIEQRLTRQKLQPLPGQEGFAYPDFTVIADSGNGVPTKTAVILASNPALPFDQDQYKWQQEVAGPMWKLANDAVHKEASLQKVSNFDAQVAGDAQRDAILALLISIFFIMIYIWLRFGNLKYGTATVAALLHDTIFTIAALGLAHYIADSFIGHALLIEPFRINLTIVAGILTIMGYSMVDTIVVFDRIRENRGKYGHLDRKVVNDAINQTLSRTLLTAGTTIVTVTVMYIWGGPGIHGFTFVLLLGILVGTYSSIAIAAPILLIGGETQPATPTQKASSGQQKLAAAR